MEAGISAFILFEICGAASFRLSKRELESWLYRFTTVYPVQVIDASGLQGKAAQEWWDIFLEELSERLSRNLTFGDALLIREAENYGVEAIITWNTRDFLRRTKLPLFTPTEFLRRR